MEIPIVTASNISLRNLFFSFFRLDSPLTGGCILYREGAKNVGHC